MENYTVKSHRNGKHTVAYECLMCKAPLESPLDEAGTVFPCPTCGEKLKTPGTKELESQREAVLRAKQAKQDAAKKLAAASIEKIKTTPPPLSKPAGQPAAIASVQKPMSGRKLFVIISGAVACGITVAVLGYFIFFTAVFSSHRSHASGGSTLKPADQALVDAIQKGDIDAVKEDRAIVKSRGWPLKLKRRVSLHL